MALAMPLAAAASPASTSVVYPAPHGQAHTVRVSTPDVHALLRHYTQITTQPVRQGQHLDGKQETSYEETAQLPTVRSGSLAFDALFALAGAEMRRDAVSQIQDGSYNGGKPIACDCFKTGELWHYVWTRDLSYAAALSLAMLDPQRVRNSLTFKLAGWRAGVTPGAQVAGSADGLQIVQDTGSGGSWPVSTDRMSWAFGADEALKALPPAERQAFAVTALKALRNTIENDRLAAYDTGDGLYTGEQSFLDWREQSYAAWIPDDLASMATSKALSTNVAHYQALTLAARLAREQGDAALARRYDGWAAALKLAINRRFWQADTGMYSSLTAGHFDGAALYKYDWLGQSLAIIHGIADTAQAQSILAHYPHGPLGAPVIFPQQQGVAVYHNRAMWPFVTAHGLRAAAMTGNVAVADAAYDTLLRGAALNLSNMENFEWLSGQPLLTDKQAKADLSGPVVNSRQMLWSIGGYLGMVVGEIFGVRTTDTGIVLHPFVTAKLRREAFGASDAVTLNNLQLRGKRLQVQLRLPAAAPADRQGYYAIDSITVNGKRTGATLDWSALSDDNHIEVRLGQLLPGQQAIRRVDGTPLHVDPALYAPFEPRATLAAGPVTGATTVQIAYPGNAQGVVYNVYRNGQPVATGLTASTWTDRAPGTAGNACYAVEAMYASSGNRSHHSAPVCVQAGQTIAVDDARVQSRPAVDGGRIAHWGAPQDTFTVRDVDIMRGGKYVLQLLYRNTAHQVNLGITGGVKWMAVSDEAGRQVAAGVVQMPHSPESAGPSYSTPLRASLKPGRYRLTLQDFYNMSYLKSNTSYGDAGGVGGPANRADLHGVRIMPAPDELP
ncbi:esterase [Duganella sp. Leaf126]|nr:esterase [Duganella sp. Leaf126]